jgi:hypothetical protein
MRLADLEGSLAQVKLDPTENCEAGFHRKSTISPHTDPRDVSLNEAAVLDPLRQVEVLANGPDDQRLDLGCRYAPH